MSVPKFLRQEVDTFIKLLNRSRAETHNKALKLICAEAALIYQLLVCSWNSSQPWACGRKKEDRANTQIGKICANGGDYTQHIFCVLWKYPTRHPADGTLADGRLWHAWKIPPRRTLQAAFLAPLGRPWESTESTCFDLTKLEFWPTDTSPPPATTIVACRRHRQAGELEVIHAGTLKKTAPKFSGIFFFFFLITPTSFSVFKNS